MPVRSAKKAGGQDGREKPPLVTHHSAGRESREPYGVSQKGRPPLLTLKHGVGTHAREKRRADWVHRRHPADPVLEARVLCCLG